MTFGCKRWVCVNRTSGWDYNQPMSGGFHKPPFEEQETGPGLVLIEGGTFDLYLEQDKEKRVEEIIHTEVPSFYLDEAEVSNGDWIQYVKWTHAVFGDELAELKKGVLPDTLVWEGMTDQSDFYTANYFRHPSYANYPVVGVTWVQANDYCLWRTDRVNEYILYREDLLDEKDIKKQKPFSTEEFFAGQYNSNNGEMPNLDPEMGGFDPSTGKFKSKDLPSRIVIMEDGILLPRYRLPTELEWEYAASGLNNSQKKCKALPFRKYNHKVEIVPFVEEQDFSNEFFIDPSSFPLKPIYSGCQNDKGLYGMAGNVSEWVDQGNIERSKVNLPYMYVYEKRVAYDMKAICAHFQEFNEKTSQSYNDSTTMEMTNSLLEEVERIRAMEEKFESYDTQWAVECFIDDARSRLMNRDWGSDLLYFEQDTVWENLVPPFLDSFQKNLSFYELPFSVEYVYSDMRYQKLYSDSIKQLELTDCYVFKGTNWSNNYLVPDSFRGSLSKEGGSAVIGFRCAMDRIGPVGLGKKKKK